MLYISPFLFLQFINQLVLSLVSHSKEELKIKIKNQIFRLHF